MSAAELLRILAESDPLYARAGSGGLHVYCRYCGKGGEFADSPTCTHDPQCLWARARQLASMDTSAIEHRCDLCGMSRPFGAQHDEEDCRAVIAARTSILAERSREHDRDTIVRLLRTRTDSLVGFRDRGPFVGGFGWSGDAKTQGAIEAALVWADEESLNVFYQGRPRQCACGRAAVWLRNGSQCDEHFRRDQDAPGHSRAGLSPGGAP